MFSTHRSFRCNPFATQCTVLPPPPSQTPIHGAGADDDNGNDDDEVIITPQKKSKYLPAERLLKKYNKSLNKVHKPPSVRTRPDNIPLDEEDFMRITAIMSNVMNRIH